MKPRSSWRADALPLLGTVTDKEIAARFNVAPSSVHNLREKHGIPRHVAPGRLPTDPAWVTEAAPLFGQISDAAIGRLFGITRERVRQVRTERRIPVAPFKPR
jgi:hypothetical protein